MRLKSDDDCPPVLAQLNNWRVAAFLHQKKCGNHPQPSSGETSSISESSPSPQLLDSEISQMPSSTWQRNLMIYLQLLCYLDMKELIEDQERIKLGPQLTGGYCSNWLTVLSEHTRPRQPEMYRMLTRLCCIPRICFEQHPHSCSPNFVWIRGHDIDENGPAFLGMPEIDLALLRMRWASV